MKRIQMKNVVLLLRIDDVLLDNKLEPKIYNFGRAHFVSGIPADIENEVRYILTPPICLAPEIICDEPYNTKSDVYSFAIFLYRMFNLNPKTSDGKQFRSPQQLRMKILRGVRYVKPDNMPDNYWELINLCWKADPDERPTFAEITEILKDDQFALNEYGQRTNLAELHEYQRRIDTDQEDETEALKREIEELKRTIERLQQPPRVDSFQQFEIITTEMLSDYRIIREISSGGGGKVNEVARDEKFAMKVMHMNSNSDSETNMRKMRAFMAEYEFLLRLSHPNIVKAFGIFLSDASNPPMILLELCVGDIHSGILNSTYDRVEIVFFVYQVIEAMRYVHYCHIIHRDLKPSNILVGKDGKIRVSDFGISKLMSTDEQSTTFGVGTQKFMAPELLKEEEYDEKVDVYSFGVVLFFMLSGGRMPAINIIQVGNGMKAPIPDSFTQLAKDLINSCWNFRPADRPSFQRLVESLESNNFMLFDLSESEVRRVKDLVQKHKLLIPEY